MEPIGQKLNGNGCHAEPLALRGNALLLGSPNGVSAEAAIAHFRRQEQLSCGHGTATMAPARIAIDREAGSPRNGHGGPRHQQPELTVAEVATAEPEAVIAAYSDLASAGGLEKALALVEAAVQAGRSDVLSRYACVLAVRCCVLARHRASVKACDFWRSLVLPAQPRALSGAARTPTSSFLA